MDVPANNGMAETNRPGRIFHQFEGVRRTWGSYGELIKVKFN